MEFTVVGQGHEGRVLFTRLINIGEIKRHPLSRLRRAVKTEVATGKSITVALPHTGDDR